MSEDNANDRIQSDAIQIPENSIRVKNIHPDLTQEDLEGLFGQIAPVEYVKFDEEKKGVAYVGFQDNTEEFNRQAISKFDGRKAMGKILIVEDPLKPKVVKSLKDRLGPLPGRGRFDGPRRHDRGTHERSRHDRGSRYRPNQKDSKRGRGRERIEKKAPKSVEDLDRELSEYMNSN